MNRQVQMEVLYTEEMRRQILAHLEQLLADTHFSLSKRFPTFLRYIVDEELSGRGSQLKERTLGVEVFGRRPDYDTTVDPIVRVTAAEIRKRIAQFYQGTGSDSGLRISLPPGSYVPHFEWPATPSPALEPDLGEQGSGQIEGGALPEEIVRPLLVPLLGEATAHGNPNRGGRPHWMWVAVAGLVIVLAGFGYRYLHPPMDPFTAFWAPVLAAEDHTVVICFPHSESQTVTLRDARQPALTHSFPEPAKALYLDDVQPLVNIAGLLGQAHRQYLLLDDTVPLTDLRRGPTVFLGAFDNDWTLRITHDLRFHFNNDAEMQHFWIEDGKHPERHWQVDRGLQVSTNNYRDYAIVARFVSPSTGQLAVVSAGIARGGTVAAGEFLTRASTMNAIQEHAPPGWTGQNMEFVLSTEIIDGRSAPPRIEAMEFW